MNHLNTVFRNLCVASLIVLGIAKSEHVTAQEPNSKPPEGKLVNAIADDPTAADPKYLALQKLLSNKRLVGLFTISGKPMKELTEETYEIKKIEKLAADDDLWQYRLASSMGTMM